MASLLITVAVSITIVTIWVYRRGNKKFPNVSSREEKTPPQHVYEFRTDPPERIHVGRNE